ncbi:MAG: Rho termination factor N-terminal domain-containing protein [Desulfobacterales bacterium]
MSDKKAEATDKPLEKMTVKALREMAKEIPEITGVHGMKKEELLVAINEVRGVEAETVEAETVEAETSKAETVKADKSIQGKPVKKTGSTTGEIKKQIKALKAQRQAALGAKDKKMATVFKRRISRLKKKSRKAAA